MNGPYAQRRRRTILAVAAALLAVLFVLVLLFPVSGTDTRPPQCSSAFGYAVPCEAGVVLAVAAAAAIAAGAVAWWIGSRSRLR
jgi:hypothetical protein